MNSRLGPGGKGFDATYAGLPPWDIGRPQQAYVELVQTGKIHGSVLDVGCGTGEHALYLVEHGHVVLGGIKEPTPRSNTWWLDDTMLYFKDAGFARLRMAANVHFR